MKKISILTSGHYCTDERLFHKIGNTLSNNNFELTIISSVHKINEIKNNIKLIGFTGNSLPRKEKMKLFEEQLFKSNPDLIISAEVFPMLPALSYKKENPNSKIIYDVTEWYPENMTRNLKGIKKVLKYSFLYLTSYYLIKKVDALLIGEKRKLERMESFVRQKPKTIIPYFPPLQYFNYSQPPFDENEITFCFTGHLNEERGVFRFANVVNLVSQKYKEIDFRIKLIGKFDNEQTKDTFEKYFIDQKNVTLEIHDWMNFENISNALADVDICFDLRNKEFFFNNSLPIKIFEYMACGKPVIYSNVDAILDEFNNNEFGYFVNPFDSNEMISKIENYLSSIDLLKTHSENGRKLVEEKYNWEFVERKLINFINTVLTSA